MPAAGPALHFLAPFDTILTRGEAYSLTAREYVIVKDTQTGAKRVERGPSVFVPGAYEEVLSELLGYEKREALALEATNYVRLRDTTTGRKWVVRGPTLLVPEPTWELVDDDSVQSAFSLKRTEYVRLIDEASGAIRVERGEKMVFPEATERVLEGDGGKLTAINLKVFQYVKLIDNASGVIRVVRGEATVFLGPTESIIGKGKVDAVAIDTDTAVQVRSKRTGELMLVSKGTAGELEAGGLFFPKAEEDIVEVQRLIKLADYECMAETHTVHRSQCIQCTVQH